MKYVALATEDELSEAIGRRLLHEADPEIQVNLSLRRQGFGYLRSRIKNFCEIATRQPVVILTDLDSAVCPAALVATWLSGHKVPANLLLRVAHREVESWLLADHEGIKSLLGARVRKLPENPDGLNDPKTVLLQLARVAPKSVRDELRAPVGAIARQGLGYNATLVEFVQCVWDPERASARSSSLNRTRQRMRDLVGRITGLR